MYFYVPKKSSVGLGGDVPGIGVVIRLLVQVGTVPNMFWIGADGWRVLYSPKTVISWFYGE